MTSRYLTLFRSLIELSLLSLLLPAIAHAQGRIDGQIVNGTSQQPVDHQKIILLMPRDGMQQVGDVTSDASGHFVFSEKGIDPKSFYLLQANFEGVPYHAPAQFNSNGSATVGMTVYDSTRNPAAIHVNTLRVLVAAQGAKIRVQEEYQVENSSRPGHTYANPEGTFVFHASTHTGEPTVTVTGLMNMALPQAPERGPSPGDYKIRYALKPGSTAITVSYDADYAGSAFSLEDRAPFPIDHVEMFVFPASLKVGSAVFKSIGADTANDIQKFEARNLARGATLAASVSGESASSARAEAAGSEPVVKSLPNTMTRLGIPLFACFLLVLLWALGVRVSKEWSGWKERKPTSPARKQLEAKAEALFNSLADLDELFAAGKIENKKYWKERLELKAKLMAILKKGQPSPTEPYAARRNPR